MYQFYDRVDVDKEYPTGGFSLINDWVAATTAGMKPGEYGMYFNYPDPQLNQTTAQKMYWGESLPRLQKLKAAVDPQEIFYLPQSVRPATIGGAMPGNSDDDDDDTCES
jgi:hypothetical protein